MYMNVSDCLSRPAVPLSTAQSRDLHQSPLPFWAASKVNAERTLIVSEGESDSTPPQSVIASSRQEHDDVTPRDPRETEARDKILASRVKSEMVTPQHVTDARPKRKKLRSRSKNDVTRRGRGRPTATRRAGEVASEPESEASCILPSMCQRTVHPELMTSPANDVIMKNLEQFVISHRGDDVSRSEKCVPPIDPEVCESEHGDQRDVTTRSKTVAWSALPGQEAVVGGTSERACRDLVVDLVAPDCFKPDSKEDGLQNPSSLLDCVRKQQQSDAKLVEVIDATSSSYLSLSGVSSRASNSTLTLGSYIDAHESDATWSSEQPASTYCSCSSRATSARSDASCSFLSQPSSRCESEATWYSAAKKDSNMSQLHSTLAAQVRQSAQPSHSRHVLNCVFIFQREEIDFLKKRLLKQ